MLLALLLGLSWAALALPDAAVTQSLCVPERDSKDLHSYLKNEDFTQRSRRQVSSVQENQILDKIRTATSTKLASPSRLSAKFSQGYIDLGSRDPVEEGAATLAFVFDTTGSMSDDMKQVRDGAGKILRTVLEKFERPIHNYVFVPFHDPGKSVQAILSSTVFLICKPYLLYAVLSV